MDFLSLLVALPGHQVLYICKVHTALNVFPSVSKEDFIARKCLRLPLSVINYKQLVQDKLKIVYLLKLCKRNGSSSHNERWIKWKIHKRWWIRQLSGEQKDSLNVAVCERLVRNIRRWRNMKGRRHKGISTFLLGCAFEWHPITKPVKENCVGLIGLSQGEIVRKNEWNRFPSVLINKRFITLA